MNYYKCIYIIQNKINNKIYVGQTNNPKQRWIDHRKPINKNKYKSYLYYSMDKYGVENFVFSILEEFTSENEQTVIDCANESEEFFIALLMAQDRSIGYNVDPGGNNKIKTFETRQKLSLALKGKKKKPFSKETRKKMSIAHIGKVFSKEHKSKISNSKKGNKFAVGTVCSKKHKQQISIANKGNKHALGFKHSNETKEKQRLSKIGNKNPNFDVCIINWPEDNILLNMVNNMGINATRIQLSCTYSSVKKRLKKRNLLHLVIKKIK